MRRSRFTQYLAPSQAKSLQCRVACPFTTATVHASFNLAKREWWHRERGKGSVRIRGRSQAERRERQSKESRQRIMCLGRSFQSGKTRGQPRSHPKGYTRCFQDTCFLLSHACNICLSKGVYLHQESISCPLCDSWPTMSGIVDMYILSIYSMR